MAKKKAQKVVVSTASKIISANKINTVLPLSPSLNEALGGGLEESTLALIQARSGTGKSMICMSAAAQALKQGRYVVYCDVERRITDPKYFRIYGLDVDSPKFLWIRSEKGCVLSGDDIYNKITEMMSMDKYFGALYILDSFSKIIPIGILDDKSVTSQRRDSTPRLNADFCKKAGNIARVNNSIILGVQHLIQDTGMYSVGLVPDGGNKLTYEADVVLLSKKHPLDWDGNKLEKNASDQIGGQKIEWLMPHNKRRGPIINRDNPIETYLRFDEGFYFAMEMMQCMSRWCRLDDPDFFYLERKGNSKWYEIWTGDKYEKCDGKDNALEFIDKNREVFEKLERQYMETIYGAKYDFKPLEEPNE